MNNQEAIELLKIERDHMTPTLFTERVEAMDMAISALQAQDSPKPTAESVQNVPNDELISRKAAIDAAIKADMENNSNVLSEKRARVIDRHISAVPSTQPNLQPTCNQLATDCISRQAALNAINEICERCGEGKKYNGVMCGACNLDGVADIVEDLPSAQPEPCEDAVSREAAISQIKWWFGLLKQNPDILVDAIKTLPTAQPDGWLEQNKDKILQAGMEGREIDFRIGGRLFAIREKAQ